MTQEIKKHPHDAVIRAWLDGKTIQYQHPVAETWNDVTRRGDEGTPAFLKMETWRIKPEDPDVYVNMYGYNGATSPNEIGRGRRVKMKLSEFKKIAQIED